MLIVIDGALALAVEIGLIAAAVRGGWIWSPGGGPTAWIVGLVLAVVVVAVWSVWLAPASGRRLGLPWLAVVKAALFLGGTLALFGTGLPRLGTVFAAAAALSLGLGIVVARAASE